MKKIYLILSAIFLFNPIFSTIDIFPDFIGYILLMMAFSKLSYVDDRVNDLSHSIKIMVLITGIKLVSLFVVLSLDQTMLLVSSFVFAILELVFGIPMLVKLFDALSVFALMGKKEELYRHRFSNNDKIKKFSIVALASRVVLATIPDFTLLSISNGVDSQVGINFARFRPMLFVLLGFISLIIGAIWLVKIIGYFNRLMTKETSKALQEYFNSKAEGRDTLFSSRDSMTSIILLCIGALFVLDFNLNLVNVFPDSLFSLIIILSFTFLIVKKHIKLSKMYFLIATFVSLHIATDTYLTVVTIKFFDKYNLNSIEKISDAEDIYFKICTLSVISAVLLIFVVAFSLYYVNKNAEKALKANSYMFSGVDVEYCVLEFKKTARKNLIASTALSIIASASYACYMIFRHIFEATTLINTVAEMGLIIALIRTLLYVYDNVYKRILIHS